MYGFDVEIYGFIMKSFAPNRTENILSGDGRAIFDVVLHEILGIGYWVLGIGYWVKGSRFVFYRTNYALGMILERRRKSRRIG